jgi:hypothetical protein
MRVPLPRQPPHPCPPQHLPPARLRQQPPLHRPSQPVRPSQPTRSRPTPPQRQTSGSEQRENQGAPARQQGQRPRQSICPCARRVQNGFCHQVRRTCTPQANRSSQSACGGPATVGSAPGFYINVGLFADEQCAQGAVSAAERGAARVSPDAGWRQGHRVRVRVGPYASRSQAEAAAATVKSVGTGSRGVPQVALTGKHQLTKPLSSIPNPTTRLLYVTKNSARC